MTTDIKRARLSAFVGRSFLPDDKMIWHELRDILDSHKSMGFEYDDAKEAQLRPISDKVKELIMRHEIYIGVLTRRFPIWQAPSSWPERWLSPLGSYVPQKWTTSEWVIEEIGFAIGRDRKVLLLIEEGVNFPTTDLDADTQWIPFNRKNLSASQTEINQMISGLLSQKVTSIVEPASLATVAPIGQEKAAELKKQSMFEQVNEIREQVLSGNVREADRIQDKLLEAETDTKERNYLETFLLGVRARMGDTDALECLKHKCDSDPSDSDAIEALSDVYSSFKQFNQATELLVSHLDTVPIIQRSMLAIRASQELCNDSKATQAISLLLECLQKESGDSAHAALFREIARAAEKANLTDIETAFLEKVLKIVPTNNEARFRLAFVYSANDLNQLAAHHYKLVVAHTDWPSASNNLGVTYGNLGLKANQYKLYKAVADREALAKSNLAVLYATAGFLSDAEDFVKAVLSTHNDDSDTQLAINRARYALEEITTTEKTEREAIDRIADDTKAEREFMCAYAEAYCVPLPANDRGIFTTPHGEIEIVREQAELKGKGTFTKTTWRGGLLATLYSRNIGEIASEPEVSTYSLSLTAQLHGQSGTFELKIALVEKQPTILGDSTRTIKGLMYFQDNGNVIQFLERDEKKRTVVSAQRKN